jgi:mannosyltransferase OCH1-like enzyme
MIAKRLVILILVCAGVLTVAFRFTRQIPRIIHQTAPADPALWPPIWSVCQKTWLDLARTHGFQYRFWSDQDIDLFMKSAHPEFYPTYKAYPRHIQRVDAARYFILWDYGGIYADMDFAVLEDFYNVLPPGKVSIVESPHTGWEVHQNSLMASPAGHPFWPKVFRAMQEEAGGEGAGDVITAVVTTTGPKMLDKVIARGGGVHVLPKDKFNPVKKADPVAEAVAKLKGTNPSLYTFHFRTVT